MTEKNERFERFYQDLREFQTRQFAQRLSPMQPIEQQDSAVEIVLMESWLDDEIRCEGNHVVTPCTVEVTTLITWCVKDLRACDSWADLTRNRREVKVCSHCKRPAKDCWDIRPI